MFTALVGGDNTATLESEYSALDALRKVTEEKLAESAGTETDVAALREYQDAYREANPDATEGEINNEVRRLFIEDAYKREAGKGSTVTLDSLNDLYANAETYIADQLEPFQKP